MNTTSATPPQPRPEDQWSAAGTIGLILVRIVVPLWVLSGALFKIAERSPKLLPKNFIQQMEGIGFDLYLVLALLIAIEFVAVAVMLLIPKLARVAAVFMLVAFCLVLLNELRAGNIESCGCLGAASPPPWLMLIIDFILLLGVVFFKPRPLQLTSPRNGWIIATGCILITSGLAFGLVLSEAGAGGVITIEPKTDPASSTAQNDDATTPTTTTSLPSYYVLDTSDWVGKNIQDIDLVQYITNLPDSINEGQQYLIFYSRTCDHCQMLLELYFGYGSPVPTTLVAIPESKSGFATEGLLENPCLDCTTLELPVGTDWLMTPPILLAIEDGIVQCAKEGEDSEMPECMPW
ncbi:MAG: DoxX family protein [Phycisphaerales bacterium]|nr:DoxX family protein [Phycisphaerales bacterium]